LALELGIIDKETIEPLIQKAHREALGILFELPVYFDDMRDEYIRKAASNASAIKAIVLGEDLQVPTKKKKRKKEKVEEDEEVGIGGLFGN
jgi:hypothetical protein